MEPLTLMAIGGGLSALSSGNKFFAGRKQEKEGREMLDSLQDPFFDIPEEVEENVLTAENLANQGLTREERNFYQDRAAQNQATGITQFRGRRAGIEGAEQLGEQALQSNRELLFKDAQMKIQNIRNMMQQKQVMADYKTMAFDINEMQPFERDYNQANALIGAGRQNKMSAISDFGQSLNSAIQGAASQTNT